MRNPQQLTSRRGKGSWFGTEWPVRSRQLCKWPSAFGTMVRRREKNHGNIPLSQSNPPSSFSPNPLYFPPFFPLLGDGMRRIRRRQGYIMVMSFEKVDRTQRSTVVWGLPQMCISQLGWRDEKYSNSVIVLHTPFLADPRSIFGEFSPGRGSLCL